MNRGKSGLSLGVLRTGYSRHNGATNVCEQCCARRSGLLSYKDQSDTAWHRHTELSHESYLRTNHSNDLSPWVTYPDFNIRFHRGCTQHILFQEGVASFVAFLKLLVFQGRFGLGDLASRIEFAFLTFANSKYYFKDRHKPAAWTIRRLHMNANTFPRVGALYKHGQVRAFLRFTAHEADLAVGNGAPESMQLASACVRSLDAFVQLLDSRPCVLSDHDRMTAFNLGRQFRNTYTVLLTMSEMTGDFVWGATPKCHQLDHCISHLSLSCMNSLYQWACWTEESFMGVSASTTRSVTAMDAGLISSLEKCVLWLHSDFGC